MEEYIKVLMEQIRCQKAHPYIKEEIQGHIEAQMEDNMAAGMSREEAEKAAVADMGSPVEAGIALDRIHKPKMNWGLVCLMAVIGLAGIVLHELMWRHLGKEAMGSLDFVKYTIAGFVLMLLVYRLDYSVIARFSKVIAAVLIGICVFALLVGETAGGDVYLEILGRRVSLFFMMLLYVPVYAAVIYKYYGQGYAGLFKAVLWMIVPVVIAFRLPKLMLSLLLLASMLVVLTVAVAHGWFKVAKKKTIAALWGCMAGVPLVSLALVLWSGMLQTHQIMRIKAFFINTDNMGANYLTWRLRTMLENSRFWGNSWESGSKELTGYIPNYNTDYVFSYVLSRFGILLGILLCCVLVALVVVIFRISFKQKNQLAMCMGCGCGMVIGLNVLINIAENIGVFPITETFLPFFSRGGGGILVCYVLMGVVLSIYRYKNIYPAHVNTRLGKVGIVIHL